MKIRGLITLATLVLSVSILGACGAGSTEDKVTAQSTNTEAKVESESEVVTEETPEEVVADVDVPVAVQDGSVSVEFYNELMRFWREFGDYDYDKEYMTKIDAMAKKFPNQTVLDEYKEEVRKHDVFLESFYLSPSNDIEQEVGNHLSSFIDHTKRKNDYVNRYADDLDNVYRDLAHEQFSEASISLDALINSMEKHGLFIE